MSEARMTSFFFSLVAWPRPTTKAQAASNSGSVGRTSRMKACRCWTKAVLICRSRGSGVRCMTSKTCCVMLSVVTKSMRILCIRVRHDSVLFARAAPRRARQT